MRILMRNTIFKTTALAGLFSCLLAFAGAFSGITVSVHAITAAEVKTEADLEKFVQKAVDEYYTEFLVKQHCDLTKLNLGEAEDLLPILLADYGIQDLSPDSIRTLSSENIKELISLFNEEFVKLLLPEDFDIWEEACEVPDTSSFRDVFGSGEGDWRSGSIYLFVIHDPEQTIIFHGLDMQLENQDLTGLKDAGERLIGDLILEAVDPPGDGFVDYCWDDPTVDGDEVEDTDPLTAPGDSWKTSYVVDPFDYLEMPPPPDSPGVIFGSGIYPKTGTPPSGCKIVGGMEEPNGDGDETPPTGDSSGGGCAIAAGSDSTSLGTAFNLLLTVFALFFVISSGSRAVGRRNGVRS